MKLSKIFIYFTFIAIFWSVASCVEPFKMDFKPNTSLFVVEANITDEISERSYVSLKTTYTQNTEVYDEYETKAKVELIINDSQSITLSEKEKGFYYLPSTFTPQIGLAYQLKISLFDNKQYISGKEYLPSKAPAIDKVYQTFVPNAIKTELQTLNPGHFIYLDYFDNLTEKNLYQFSYTLWESQAYCAYCPAGSIYISSAVGCVQNNYNNVAFDYRCTNPCWEIIQSSDININNDLLTNGKKVLGKLVAKIPFYQTTNSLIEVQIASISSGYYAYQKLIEEQAQSNGGLADTPPAAIIGNIKNMSNANEPVIGYFALKRVSSKRYKIDRTDAKGQQTSLLGHAAVDEPANPIGRPPTAPCVISKSRTSIQPKGW